MPVNGSDYTNAFVAKPDVLPTPPTPYPLSNMAAAVGEYAKSMVPKASMENIKARLIPMAGPGAGYGNFLGQAAQGAANLIGDVRTLRDEPIGSQPWLGAGLRTAGELAGTSRMFMGGKYFGDPYTGTTLPPPVSAALPRWSMAGESELAPATTASSYVPRPKTTFRQYNDAYQNAVTNGDNVGAQNIVKNAFNDGHALPVQTLDHMPREMLQDFMNKYMGPIQPTL